MKRITQPPGPDGRQEEGAGEEDGGAEPDGELVDDSPPPPDTPIVRLEDRSAGRQRGWFIGVYLAVLVTLILASLLGPASLPEPVWLRVRPEVAEARFWTFQVGVLIAGYLFFDRRRR
ncbi:hypothetical protein [Nonomuraea candida]|uniref:hypothetical protein n=1 Tax=Nonomuraea candida TaxID=359159 RepID=UPI0005BE2B2C|nr:hypothetical protein [Nonomuraea candida]